MKKIYVVILLFLTPLFLVPAVVGAHTGSDESMPMMDTGEESTAVSQEEFNEMEEIMLKMMNGEELSNSEAQEMYSFMQSHHGSGWPMMMGYGGMGMYDSFNRPHMFGGFGSAMGWLYPLTVLVWLGAGILLLVMLIKRIGGNTHEQ